MFIFSQFGKLSKITSNVSPSYYFCRKRIMTHVCLISVTNIRSLFWVRLRWWSFHWWIFGSYRSYGYRGLFLFCSDTRLLLFCTIFTVICLLAPTVFCTIFALLILSRRPCWSLVWHRGILGIEELLAFCLRLVLTILRLFLSIMYNNHNLSCIFRETKPAL